MPQISEWQRGYTAACFERDLDDLFDEVERLPRSIPPAARFDCLRYGLNKIIRSYNELDEGMGNQC